MKSETRFGFGQAERAVKHDLGAFELRADGLHAENSADGRKPEAYCHPTSGAVRLQPAASNLAPAVCGKETSHVGTTQALTNLAATGARRLFGVGEEVPPEVGGLRPPLVTLTDGDIDDSGQPLVGE